MKNASDVPAAMIWIADDDRELGLLLQEYLQQQGLQVLCLHDAESVLAQLRDDQRPHLLVLDVMLPGMDGLTALRQIRELDELPVIMLSGRSAPDDRVQGLELGADDYLSKPCLPRELLARIQALLRRTRSNAALELRFGVLRVQIQTRKAFLGEALMSLTGAEFAVLAELTRHAGELVSKEQLCLAALNRPLEKFDRAIDVHVSRLRGKLAQHPQAPLLDSVRGGGYQMRSAE